MRLPFPLKGWDKNWALVDQPPHTTPIILNMRPYDIEDMRARGGASPSVDFPTRDNTTVRLFGETYDDSDIQGHMDIAEEGLDKPRYLTTYRGRIVAIGPKVEGEPDKLPEGLRHKNMGVPEEGEDPLDTESDFWDEYQWAMSRQGDPTDWVYFANDPGTPIAGACSPAGKCGASIICAIPFHDDYLVFGCENSMYLLRGDPAFGGSLDVMLEHEGIISENAWCFDPQGVLYFATPTGLYRVAPGQSMPENVTKDSVPDLFFGVDEVRLEYDKRYMGINIVLTGTTYPSYQSGQWYPYMAGVSHEVEYYGIGGGGTHTRHFVCVSPLGTEQEPPHSDWQDMGPAGQHTHYPQYWYDFRTGGVFPEDENSSTRKVVYAPVPLGQGDYDRGKLTELSITTGNDTNFTCNIYVAESAIELKDKVKDSNEDEEHTINANRSRQAVIRTNLTGAYLAVEFTSSNAFSVENVEIAVQPVGMLNIVSDGQNLDSQLICKYGTNEAVWGPGLMAPEGFNRAKMTRLITTFGAGVSENVAQVFVGSSEKEVRQKLIDGVADFEYTYESPDPGRQQVIYPYAEKNEIKYALSGLYCAVKFDSKLVEDLTIDVVPVAVMSVYHRNRRSRQRIAGNISPDELTFGPFEMGGRGFSTGVITTLDITTNYPSGSLDLEIYTGANPEECWAKKRDGDEAYDKTFSVSQKRLNTIRPRSRGGFALIRITTSGVPDIEQVVVNIEPAGRVRV